MTPSRPEPLGPAGARQQMALRPRPRQAAARRACGMSVLAGVRAQTSFLPPFTAHRAVPGTATPAHSGQPGVTWASRRAANSRRSPGRVCAGRLRCISTTGQFSTKAGSHRTRCVHDGPFGQERLSRITAIRLSFQKTGESLAVGRGAVHVAVDQTGRQHLAGGQVHGVPPGQRAGVQRLYSQDRSVKVVSRGRRGRPRRAGRPSRRRSAAAAR
jgi:hypothetical protein